MDLNIANLGVVANFSQTYLSTLVSTAADLLRSTHCRLGVVWLHELHSLYTCTCRCVLGACTCTCSLPPHMDPHVGGN